MYLCERSNPTSKEQQLHWHRRAERSYSTFKVRRDSHEEITLDQGKEQLLHFAGAALKRYPTSREKKAKKDGRCYKRASEGRHVKTIITEN